MRAPFSQIPAMPIAIGLIAGIVAFNAGLGVAVAVAAVVLFAALLLLQKHYVAFISAAIAVGWFTAYINRPCLPPENVLAAETVDCYGYVTAQKEYDGARHCVVRVQAVDGKEVNAFNCATLTSSREPVVAYGDTVMFRAALSEVRTQLDVPYELDYSAFYKVDGVAVSADVLPDDFHVLAHGSSLMCSLRGLRGDLIDAIISSPLSPQTQTLLMACIAGDDLYVSEQLKTDFRVSGIAHLLALSGFHVGIIVIIFNLLLYPLRLWRRVARWRHLIIIAAIWAYACMLGLMPSVTRAAVMMTVFLIARLVQRHRVPYNSLSIAAIVILIFKPYNLFSPGFQLSFAAVLAILLLAERLNPIEPRKYRLHSAVSLITVSFSAMLGTVVVSVYYFHTIPLLFLTVNTVMALLFPVFMLGGIAVIALSACGLKVAWLAVPIDRMYDLIDYVSRSVAALDYAQVSGIFLTPLDVVVLLIVITLFVIAVHSMTLKPWLWFGIVTAAAVLIIILDREQVADDEMFILRPRGRTDMLVRHLDSCILLTTASPTMYPEVEQYARRHYDMYFQSRRCYKEVHVCNRDFVFGTARRVGNVVLSKDHAFLLLTRDVDIDSLTIKPDYALLTRGFHGSLSSVITRLHPDTLLISHDCTRPKRIAYIDTCRLQNQAYRCL